MRWLLKASVCGFACMVAVGAAGGVSAMWAKMTLEELIHSSDLVVLGTLETLGPERRGRFEIGTIAIEEVLAGRKDLTEATLLVPARDRGIRSSTEVTYRAGQRGVWFLRLQPEPEGMFYLADHPQRFQPLDALDQVKAALRSGRKP